MVFREATVRERLRRLAEVLARLEEKSGVSPEVYRSLVGLFDG